MLTIAAQNTLQNKPALDEVLTAIAPEIKPAPLVKPTVEHKAIMKKKYVSTNFKLTVTGKIPQDTTMLKMLASDTLINDSVTQTFHMRGHAIAQVGNTIIRANYIRINLKERKLFASKVRVEDNENRDDKTVIFGDSIRYDLITHHAFSYQRRPN